MRIELNKKVLFCLCVFVPDDDDDDRMRKMKISGMKITEEKKIVCRRK
jgi:hypothetical protein